MSEIGVASVYSEMSGCFPTVFCLHLFLPHFFLPFTAHLGNSHKFSEACETRKILCWGGVMGSHSRIANWVSCGSCENACRLTHICICIEVIERLLRRRTYTLISPSHLHGTAHTDAEQRMYRHIQVDTR